ncbi:type IV pilus modification protein PilV [Alloalcanivorax profundimaris]|uniref:type IV pilus modification protein PilV n=1 Tax=Alloalcanivorax profundimaris TaxID=2735259 RepID=UPI000C3D8231|nr:type IV pilus modification protein PilV [Alloalcanivorax profundimaris]MAO60934.1 type IV pilus modification protein PilV [Alcanivorax sp.]MCQ6263228.1 type IV pilus modification protein PilV [Alcanivorax sp. MM125-6]MAY12038.1 type IV pilus modification protein PilV [Alcanivorax sp.]MBF1801052.1 type IV pilus modification protein PilV [Alloalcanivorax profundimaris]MBI55640.1 type IV pilus modification protein PilV [Alcanivorax sp.]|tara:strand:+ start:367 stop:864 length:498 start_codon:yes stop_codon:yes gene_type:complete
MKQQTGVGMVEILVALLVLAIGVLGYAGLQLSALKGSESAQTRAQATALARDALERILVNGASQPTYLDQNNWGGAQQSFGDAPPTDCYDSTCDTDEVAAWDIEELEWQAGNLLPAGRIQVQSCGGGITSCVVVAWRDQDIDDCVSNGQVAADEDTECVVMEVAR